MIRYLWSMMIEIRVGEGVSYPLELIEEISVTVRLRVSNDVANAMSMFQVRFVC